MWLAGRLPLRAHRWCARVVYGWRFFNTIISYMPTAHGPRWVLDAPVLAMTPVLPLTDHVPLTVGILVDDTLGLSDQDIHDSVMRAFVAVGGQVPMREADHG